MRPISTRRPGMPQTILVGLLATLVAGPLGSQERGLPGPEGGQAAFSLGPAFPNPFERETRIPFVLGEDLFARGRSPIVSMRVYNLLHQLVGHATIEIEDESVRRLDGLPLPRPGRYEASWDGRDLDGELVTEGPYFIQISVNGRTQVRKVLFVR